MRVSRETAGLAPAAPHEAASRETATSRSRSPLAAALLVPIRAYRRFLSPASVPRCRYYPTCSAYAEESIVELGAVRGTILATWRLLRCNPFAKGGFDPLSERRLFRSTASPEGVDPA